jgi:small subunit ribosomal protein S5
MISIRRVARVVAGGRRFSFSVTMVLGDKAGRVGVGVGKAGDTQLAIEKASRAAKKHMITLKLTETKSLPFNVEAKYCASVVEIRPSKGRGLVAGSAVRTVLELAGVNDVTAKLLSRSKNPINNARAAIKALERIAA